MGSKFICGIAIHNAIIKNVKNTRANYKNQSLHNLITNLSVHMDHAYGKQPKTSRNPTSMFEKHTFYEPEVAYFIYIKSIYIESINKETIEIYSSK